MASIEITLTRSQLDRLTQVLPNIHDYVRADGTLDPGCEAYRLGMRTREELDALIGMVRHGNGNRRTMPVTLVQAKVLRDRLEMAYEIAADNAGYVEGATAEARSYRDGMSRITAALAAAGEG